ncbi:hypothetical protein RM697_01310 [Ichthyenterobacterium sp. W332]|uniref:Uncharacterized protein n=1 Tax=Microcosmobacter mediterraneus TaxID=3075607 RepID=A0ABU2YHU3_9FLAO|nr:hypothetical protein [Ichthyenterobacterium sp. W332]MDT0557264.1 hypothetical protein [Ichthyenterobacterium sp. W332]
MKKILSTFFFYKTAAIPSLIISIGLGSLTWLTSGQFSFQNSGLAFVFLTPLFHYFIYEIRNPNTYFFYYNLGFSKRFLWLFTVIASCILGLILMCL